MKDEFGNGFFVADRFRKIVAIFVEGFFFGGVSGVLRVFFLAEDIRSDKLT